MRYVLNGVAFVCVGLVLFGGGYATGKGALPVKAHDPQAIQASDLDMTPPQTAEEIRLGHLNDVWIAAADSRGPFCCGGYCWSESTAYDGLCGKWVPVKELVERLVRDAGYEWTPGTAATEGSMTKPKPKGAR